MTELSNYGEKEVVEVASPLKLEVIRQRCHIPKITQKSSKYQITVN